MAASRTTRSLVLLDPSMAVLQACLKGHAPDETAAYVAVSDFDSVIGDAVADTVICPGLLSQATDVRAFLAFGGAFLVVTIAEAIGSNVGAALRDRLGRGVANRLDAALGALFGISQALVLAWLIGGLLATGPFPSLAGEAQQSVAVRSLLGAFPPPSGPLHFPKRRHR